MIPATAASASSTRGSDAGSGTAEGLTEGGPPMAELVPHPDKVCPSHEPGAIVRPPIPELA